MAEVHATTSIVGDVDLAETVTIGPNCVLDGRLGPIRIDSGSRLIGSTHLCGPLTIGRGNTVYPFVCLGFAPQSLGYDNGQAGCGVVIGDDNTFREGVTIHRALTDHGPTTVGNDNYFMANAHVGHDVRIADHCVLANGTLISGHVVIDERVIIGGNVGVHQFCRIGRGAILSGAVALSRDLPPFFTLTGINVAGSLNMVGMRRQGLTEDQIQDVRWVYKTLYRRRLPVRQAIDALKERADRPIVAEYVEFLETSQRGLCPGHGQTKRNPVM